MLFRSGVDAVLDQPGKQAHRIDHPRAGDLIAVSEPRSWFTYYFWLDDRRAPDFARTVDIHRKPGYDPAELFIDPALSAPKARIAWALAKRKLGFRTLMEVIPTDASLVQGSHGRPAASPAAGPLLITRQKELLDRDKMEPTDVCELILRHLAREP